MSKLVYKAEMTIEEFDQFKKDKIDSENFKLSTNLAGDMFFSQINGNKMIFVYKWTGGYLVQETE